MEDKIKQLAQLILDTKIVPKSLRLFLIGEDYWVRIYYGAFSIRVGVREYGFVRNLNLERGAVLDIFAKLEFFVNELIQLKLLGPSHKKGQILDDILQYVDFFSRVRFLKEWDIIDNHLSNLLYQTKQVRNGFAHSWSEDEIKYKGKLIKNNFSDFKQDLEEAWRRLVEIYKKEQEKIDIDKFIDSILKYR
ncbi:hypothetical protein CEE35_05790 [Candidatus Aerophobetes bacterium Ae_b3b]|nr:MAG: hypothetical protein CEE35_05790 [Candidatus Aerophobetes bacterium Ae_b3b]